MKVKTRKPGNKAKAVKSAAKKAKTSGAKVQNLAGKLNQAKTDNKAKKLEGVEKVGPSDQSNLSKEAKKLEDAKELQTGEKTNENPDQSEKITNLTTALQEALAENDELKKKMEEAAPEEAPPEAHAEEAPAHAPAEAAPAHAPAPMGHEAPPMNIDMELQAMVGKVFAAQSSGQNPQQARQELSAKYQQSGGDNNQQITPQTKQMVHAALGRQGTGGLMPGSGQVMDGFFGGLLNGNNAHTNQSMQNFGSGFGGGFF